MRRIRIRVRPARSRPARPRAVRPRAAAGLRMWPRTLPAGAAVLLGVAAASWAVLAFGVQYVHTYTLAREAARLERYRRDLLVQNASLLAEIQRLRTDDQYIERLAREQLGMLRPGEMELVIVPLAPASRHDERDVATEQTEAPPGRPGAANALLQRTNAIVRGLVASVRAAAEHTLRRWHVDQP